ncbi:ABC transporter substrate-binding protein [Natrarchaeobius sp. A-rgal3]|uniref:ABC transporter substrate-binding protein n=1 Tax=Natrarchaeobius versutus TaxID=1679078 RepID=UPI00351057D0
MTDETTRYDVPTRRETIKYGGAAVGGGLLAGCTDDSPPEPTEVDGETADSDEAATDDSGYSVTMEPVGEVRFEDVPETWFPFTGDYADMGVALGQGDGLVAIGIRERFATHFYEELPGVSVDTDSLVQLWQDGTDKELFYELDADVHVIDPNFMINRIQWERADIDEIEAHVAPFFGNTIFSGSYPWQDYERYTLYEAFEKLAAVFRERERYEAFERLHDEVRSEIRSRLPDERPEIAVVLPRSDPPETFIPFVIDSGTSFKQWRDLRVEDALAESNVHNFHESRGEIDYETLLEVDPEVIVVRQQGEVTKDEFEDEFVSYMNDHDVARELQAVEHGRVIRGGAPQQGPIVHLFQLEQAAQDLHPDVFTEPELFDRQRVADIVTDGR